ncbi:hypothetical protein D5278_21185 [bacterium 1XD21-13]|nr:hypothetical protein [bacterium 1XD21-13]
MVRFEKLNNKEKSSRYFNVKARCGTAYQKDNPRYYGTYICRLWLEDKKAFYKWLDENYYVVDGEQMDIDKDILQYGNKQYHPSLCLIVPHSINTFYENIEVGKTSITYSKKTKKYSVKVSDGNKNIGANNINIYNEALDAFCDIKQGILVRMAKSLQDQIPDKVYQAMMNTDVKSINAKHYEILE